MGEEEITMDDPRIPSRRNHQSRRKGLPQMQACTGVPLYDGQPVEVGPRARLVKYQNYDRQRRNGLNIARAMEYMDCMYKMIEAVDAIDTAPQSVQTSSLR